MALKTAKGECEMASYICTICGYVYDEAKGEPDNNYPVGTAFESLPDDYLCPECGVGKEMFEKQ